MNSSKPKLIVFFSLLLGISTFILFQYSIFSLVSYSTLLAHQKTIMYGFFILSFITGFITVSLFLGFSYIWYLISAFCFLVIILSILSIITFCFIPGYSDGVDPYPTHVFPHIWNVKICNFFTLGKSETLSNILLTTGCLSDTLSETGVNLLSTTNSTPYYFVLAPYLFFEIFISSIVLYYLFTDDVKSHFGIIVD